MAIASVWMEVDALQYDQIATTLGMELAYKPVVYGISTNATVVEENEPKLAKVLDIYESRLGSLGGDCFTGFAPFTHYTLPVGDTS